MLALSASFVGADVANAQIERHDLRLYLEGGMVGWSKAPYDYGTVRGSSTATSVGPLTNGGVGIGFAATRFLVPTLAFYMQRTKLSGEGTSRNVRVWELRPSLEVPLLPALRFVPFASVGLSLMRSVDKDANVDEITGATTDIERFGYGPVIGVGLHTFLLEHASLDLSLVYRAVWGLTSSTPTLDDEGIWVEPKNLPLHSLLLNLAASFWLL
jgi:hypothetical protein